MQVRSTENDSSVLMRQVLGTVVRSYPMNRSIKTLQNAFSVCTLQTLTTMPQWMFNTLLATA